MMQTAKQAAQQVLGQLSNQGNWDEIMYELYVKESIEKGLAMKIKEKYHANYA